MKNIFIGILVFLFCSELNGQNALTSDQWQEDLIYLEEKMPQIHKNIYHTMTEQEFHSKVKNLHENIPNLSRHEIIVKLAGIVALVGDAHSVIKRFVPDQGVGFRSYPIGLYSFNDGIFIQATHRDYQAYIGARIVKIGKYDIGEAVEKVIPIITHENEMGIKGSIPFYLASPEVLHAVGVIENMEKTTFIVEQIGQQHKIELQPIDNDRPKVRLSFFPHSNWVDAKDLIENPIPLYLKHLDKTYWYEYNKAQKTMYIQYNECYDWGEQSVAEFSQEVYGVVDSNEIDRFVLDIRFNGGGSTHLNRPILLGILKREKINQLGKLFIVIGRRTFSAAQNLVNELEQYSEALFVGEPTGNNVHFYSDAGIIELPNSGIKVGMSTIWYQSMNPHDNRLWTAPDISAEPSSNDYLKGKDPVMEAILNYSQRAPLINLMSDAIISDRIDKALNIYNEYKGNSIHKYKNTETLINQLGYQLMGNNKLNEAITIFELNSRDHPNSANVWDSLAEAYMNAGHMKQAIKFYKKALELNPTSQNAADMLKKIIERK